MAEILDLSTKKERPQIKIDGILYDLILPTDLELKEALWLERAGKQIEQLADKLRENYENVSASALQKVLDKFASILLAEVPKEIRAKLTDIQKFSVVEVYARLLQEEKKSFFDHGVAPGTKSSQNSSDSMEDQSKAG